MQWRLGFSGGLGNIMTSAGGHIETDIPQQIETAIKTLIGIALA